MIPESQLEELIKKEPEHKAELQIMSGDSCLEIHKSFINPERVYKYAHNSYDSIINPMIDNLRKELRKKLLELFNEKNLEKTITIRLESDVILFAGQ
jgi:hypothetical protein